MTYAEITPPLAEPVTLAEVRAHLRLEGGEEDGLVAALAVVARQHLERVTGLVLMRRTLRLYRDDWPVSGVIQIARGPVQAIESVRVYDADGVAQSLSLDGHRLDGDARPARLLLKQCVSSGQAINGIEIDFTAGFGDSGAEVPDGLKRALLLHVAHMFAFRGVVAPAEQPAACRSVMRR